MAGIGFELRRSLTKGTYGDALQAYTAAGIIGSGPWMVSIGSLLVIGRVSRALERDPVVVTQLFAAVTYLMSASLVLTCGVGLMFVRFVADRLFEKRPELVLQNLLGVMLVTTVGAGVIGTALVLSFFSGAGVVRLLLVLSLVALCNVWILSGLLTGTKRYRTVLLVFAVGYALAMIGAVGLQRFGLAGMLLGFLVGYSSMVFLLLLVIARDYPSLPQVSFDFLNRKLVHLDLLWTGLFFGLAVWVDKYVFWFNPATSERVLGPIRYSIVYDMPISIAYLSVIPGMAVFLVRVETDFAEAYDRFYEAVRVGATLTEIRRLRSLLVEAVRDGIYDILRIQGLAVAVLLLGSERILRLFGIPVFYAYLLRVDLVATAFQVVLLGIITLLFYLDYRRLVLALTSFFATVNLVLSLVTQALGPRFYGMGFAVAAALTTLVGLAALSAKLDHLDYETFMR